MNIGVAFGDVVPTETFVRAHLNHLPFTVHPWRDFLLRPGPGRVPHPYAASLGRRVPRWMGNRVRENFLRQTQVQALLAHFGPIGARWVVPCAKVGVPLFVYFHGRDVFAEGERNKVGGYGAVFRSARTLFVVSSQMRQALIQLGADPQKIVLQPCGVDTDFFSSPILASQPHAVAVGRLVPKKRPDLVVRAFVAAAVPRARLTWVGDGPLRGETEALARELGVNVHFTGHLLPEEVRRVLGEARVYVHHGQTAPDGDAEGSPVALLEAQAMGLPAVVTRHMGLGEVVRDRQNGWIVEEGDWRGMGEGLRHLLVTPEVAESWGQEGRHRILSQYTLGQHIDGVARCVREGVGHS